MLQQVRLNLRVRIDERPDDIRPDLVLHPGGRRRDEAFDIESIGVHEEPDHGHLVVRFVRDVGHHNDALALGVRSTRAAS